MRDANRCQHRPAVAPGSGRATERLQLHAWRYYAVGDVPYERRTVLFGGPVVLSMTALASALGNRRRRQEAERAAAPQWRPLGSVGIEIRADRLLVHRDGEHGTVWLASVVAAHFDDERGLVDLFFELDAPYRFQGPQARHLADALTRVSISSRPDRPPAPVDRWSTSAS